MKARIVSVVGARPQFIKVAPLCRELARGGRFDHRLLHTGQHYDYLMSKVFFDELGIPEPLWNLDAGSGSHAAQTAGMLEGIEKALLREKPAAAIVYGDTNSTLAGALAAVKIGIPVVHVEAGLRSYRKAMPEEVNRVLVDHVSTALLCPTRNAVENLRREGFSNVQEDGRLWNGGGKPAGPPPGRPGIDAPVVANVGDIMLDALDLCLPLAEGRSGILETLGLRPREYCLATVHRAENTDDPGNLEDVIGALSSLDAETVLPAHPRLVKAMGDRGIRPGGGMRVIDPVGYLDMLVLEKNARVVLTDSGGVQKEAYFLGVPCVTLREETEWVETLEEGRNALAGRDRARVLLAFGEAGKRAGLPRGEAFGRRDAARRIARLLEGLAGGGS